MKKLIALLCILILLLPTVSAFARTRSRWAHAHRYGSRDEARIAITIDDWMYPDQWLPEFLARGPGDLAGSAGRRA